MSQSRTTLLVGHLGAALMLAFATSGANAAPDVHPLGDPLGRFLTDTGIAQGAGAIVNAPAAAASAAAAVPASIAGKIREQASDMVVTAMNFLGVRYRRGGNDADIGFDCSGFTRHVFEMSVGLVLPRRADEQAKAPGLVPVKRDELQPGDLVFFKNTYKRGISHVGMYIGGGRFVHAASRKRGVVVSDLSAPYFRAHYAGARRIVDGTGTVVAGG